MAKNKQNISYNAGLNFGVDPEALDFSQDLWSWKGEIPAYPIQSDGFSYDIVDENENDRNAISLGILGMIAILFNTKSAKIKEEDVQPALKEVIATRNWNSIQSKDANQMGKAVIAKLGDAETSGDVFDLASYAPLEIKRALLKKLFVIARHRLPMEYRDEAERRIVEDIVPLIFQNPELELAQLTGLIVKPKPVEEPPVAAPIFVTDPHAEPVSVESEDVSPEHPVEPVSQPSVDLDRDAETALQEQMERLSDVVIPPSTSQPATADEQDDYVPFSDMEKELTGQSGVPAGSPVMEAINIPPVMPEPGISDPHDRRSIPVPPLSVPPTFVGDPHSVQKVQAPPPPPVMPNVARPPVIPHSPQPPYPSGFPQAFDPHSMSQPISQPPSPGGYPQPRDPHDVNQVMPQMPYSGGYSQPQAQQGMSQSVPQPPYSGGYPQAFDPHSVNQPAPQPPYPAGYPQPFDPHAVDDDDVPPAIEQTQPRKS